MFLQVSYGCKNKDDILLLLQIDSNLNYLLMHVSKLKPLYMYVKMSAPFQCFFDVVQSISVYSEKGGGGSSI